MFTACKIIHEDNSIIVLHKPAGTASETKRIGESDCVSFIRNHIGPPDPYCAMINRLDQPVEGLLLFAKNKEAAEELSRGMREGTIGKEYLALVHTDPDEAGKDLAPEAGKMIRLTDYLSRVPGSNLSRIVNKGVSGAKKAELEYSVTEKKDGTALLKIRLLSGRHHQIRLQLSHAGLPIIGDRKYGYFPEGYRGGLCLAAVGLKFINPESGSPEEYRIQPPDWCD